LSKPVLCVPLVDTVPLQAPAASHEVELVEVQLSVAESPAFRVVDDAFNETVGAGTVRGPPPPHADASRANPAINSHEIERTDIPSKFLSLIHSRTLKSAYEHYACHIHTSNRV
jgi:hypothetical protein